MIIFCAYPDGDFGNQNRTFKAPDNNRYIRMDIALLERRKIIVRSGEGKLPKNTKRGGGKLHKIQ